MDNNIPKKSKPIDIRTYEDISVDEVSMQKLSVGLWWLKNRKNLKNTLLTVLIITSLVSWGYTFYTFGYYFIFGINEDKIMIRELVETETMSHQDLVDRGAKNLIITAPQLIKTGEKYDIQTVITNPNQKYWASFNYCFMDRTVEIECNNSFIFPNERKNILSLANDFKHNKRNIKLVIKSVNWKRINTKEIPNWKNYEADFLDFKTDDIVFKKAQKSELSEKIDISVLNFKITNQTAYDFWEVPISLILLNNNKISGVNRYIIKDFYSNETRDIKITFIGDVSALKIKIIPDLNIMDKSIIKP